MDSTTTGSGEGRSAPSQADALGGGNLGLLLAALGMGAVMGKQMIADLGALAVRVRHVRPEAVLLRAVELFSRGLQGALEETAGPLPAGCQLHREIDLAAVDLGKVARRLSRAQELCELVPEGDAAGEGEGATDGLG